MTPVGVRICSWIDVTSKLSFVARNPLRVPRFRFLPRPEPGTQKRGSGGSPQLAVGTVDATSPRCAAEPTAEGLVEKTGCWRIAASAKLGGRCGHLPPTTTYSASQMLQLCVTRRNGLFQQTQSGGAPKRGIRGWARYRILGTRQEFRATKTNSLLLFRLPQVLNTTIMGRDATR